MGSRTMCAVVGLGVLAAAPAFADGGSLEARLAQVEQRLAGASAPSAREIQASVDAYLASAQEDATLVGGPGSAGYDRGFWIRGGSFLLRTNLTLQTRFEYVDWSERSDEATPGGDLSGFSLPRATLKLSGDATCDIHYYVELEFGHAESAWFADERPNGPTPGTFVGHIHDQGFAREAWIEYAASPQFAVRMGLVKTASTRQLMTPPEMQQFVDVSLAAASVGMMMPGYTDRNRDYGVALHGALGCDGDFSYLFTITNGDGPVHRNVLDGSTNDNLAYSARLNWEFLGNLGYEECALNQRCGEWVGAVGVWGHAYSHVLSDNPHVTMDMAYSVGADLALGYGGFSFCAAYTYGEMSDGADTSACWCVQAGYLFPGTAWEVAARYASLYMEMGTMTDGATEIGFAVNYFIDGHSDKLTADVSFISAEEEGNMVGDVYAGYHPTGTGDGMLLRFQWQLAL